MKLEICIDSFESFSNAKKANADRIELCSSLSLDGLTPSVGLVKLIENENIEKFVMIRPREGNFSYSYDEFLQMKKEIEAFKNYKIDGFVFGILTDDNRLDLKRMKELIDFAKPYPCVLHRAVDFSVDFEEKIKDIINLGFIRILTSGKKDLAVNGLELIEKLQKNYGDKIEIMAGSGLNYKNMEEVYKKTKIKNYHTSARIKKSENKINTEYFLADFELIKKAKEKLESLSD